MPKDPSPSLRDLSIVHLKNADFDESEILYNNAPLVELPAYRATDFSQRFLYTNERVALNILLAICRTTDLVPVSIQKNDAFGYTIQVESDATICCEIHTIITPEESTTQRIHDMSAGLSEWISTADIGESLRNFQISFIIPDIKNESPRDAFVEMKHFLSSNAIHRLERDKIVPVPREFAALTRLDARVIVKQGKSSFVQVTRGALTVGPPAVGISRLLKLLQALDASDPARSTGSSTPRWLVIWFQAIYNPFSVSAAEPALRDYLDRTSDSAFQKILICDGRALAIMNMA